MSTINHTFDTVCQKIADVTDEATLWSLADELVVVAPKNDQIEAVHKEATTRGIPTKAANTLRLYRDVAKNFPKTDRVPLVSFSAHREALVIGDAKGARKVLLELVANHGVAGVTVTTVKSAIGAATGKVASPKATASGKVAAMGYADIAVDLTKGGKAFIAALDQMLAINNVTLDGMHAGLSAVLAQVDQRRSKAARKAAAVKSPAPVVNPSKSTAARKAVEAAKNMGKPKVPAKVGAGKAGDLRDL